MTRVAVIGANGRMGRTTCAAVEAAADMEIVARLGRDDAIADLTGLADVAVDFTVPESAAVNVAAILDAGLHAVVGTTGWDEAALDSVRARLHGSDRGVIIAPNFALSAVLAMRFASQAARWFESVEVIELHHPDKADAPSGTAVHTARAVAAARADAGLGAPPDATTVAIAGARGADVEGIPVHSVRLRGLVAHEEILLGNPGEQLTIRTDSFDRSSFMPGVLLAIRRVALRPGLTVGLDALID